MDAFLIIVTIVLTVLLLLTSLYILIVYSHPDDHGWGSSLFCKFLVVLGLTLCWAQSLILPLDVANSRGLGGGLDMVSFWFIIYIAIFIMIVFLLPFSIYYYESDEEKSFCDRLKVAFCMEFFTLVLTAMVLFISWAFLNVAQIPVQQVAKNVIMFDSSNNGFVNADQASNGQQTSSSSLEIKVSLFIYIMCLMAWIGWFLLVLFAGIGLTALPMDLILQFKYRPRILHTKDAASFKAMIKQKIKGLIEEGQTLVDQEKDALRQDGFWQKRKAKKKLKTSSNKFKSSVIQIEKEFDIFKLELDYMNMNPLVFYFKLLLGVIFLVISIIYWVHILLYIAIKRSGIFPGYPFLNKLLTGLEEANAGFIATFVFAGLCLYLLFCAIKGNFKFGIRVPFCFSIHPMKVNETWMNSFLFNVLIMLIVSVSLTQFCSNAFKDYTRLSTIDNLFGIQIRYMRFFNYFFQYNVFEIALLAWALLTLFYLLVFPSDKPKQLKDLENLRKQQKADG